MCGIFCSLLQQNRDGENTCDATSNLHEIFCSCHDLLTRRGPDAKSELSIDLGKGWIGKFSSNVLWTQGCRPTIQPATDKNGNILLWNGDVFAGLKNNVAIGDTSALLQSLSNASSLLSYLDGKFKCSDEAILDVLSRLRGPWSIIYWEACKKKLWFSRDSLGRHSLLWQMGKHGELVLTSVATRKNMPSCRELPAAGIFFASLLDSTLEVSLYPWHVSGVSFDLEHLAKIYPIEDFPPNLKVLSTPQLLSPIPSSCLSIPSEEDEFIFRLQELVVAPKLDPHSIFISLLNDKTVKERVEKLQTLLTKSVDIRCKTQPLLCQQCVLSHLNMKNAVTCSHSKVAVLFSGGVDCTVLATLADQCVPYHDPIDLINVAFSSERCQEQPKTNNLNRKERRKKEKITPEFPSGIDSNNVPESSLPSIFDVPDRLTGRKSYQELVKLCPRRTWNFVEVDVSARELAEQRIERIADLIHPRCSVLDDSLGCAVWFAARGRGTVRVQGGGTQHYTSPARILLLGMGADELLGGYSRCRRQLQDECREQGWTRLAQSLQHDLIALPARNLGRDDRVTSDSGRQARYPFLDEEVVSFLASLPSHLRTCPLPGLPAGSGEKLLLRLLATHLSLSSAATLPKRALQFGSRVAGLEARGEKGDEVCTRLLLYHNDTN